MVGDLAGASPLSGGTRPSTVETGRDGTALGLREGATLVGICRCWPGVRLVDGPGVPARWRSTARKGQLVRAAWALLGPGPIVMDTWVEDDATIEAYRSVGFDVIERQPAWERRLEA